jgi:endo-1,4-beta-xylanase
MRVAFFLILVTEIAFPQGLKDYYRSYFPIGVSVSPQSLTGEEAELIKQQFNSITAENVMKMGPIHPEENRYNWEGPDQIVAFAHSNKMKVRGHCLVWHRQTPDWIFKDKNGNEVTKDVLLQRLKDHIYAVVGRYKGKIYAWDVVNEAISDNENEFYRQSPWFRICGEEFIARAFQYAHEADPDAILFYNDYNTESVSKRGKIHKLIQDLIKADIPVGGIGIQGHWSVASTITSIGETIVVFDHFRLPIQVTELDVSVYANKTDPQTEYTSELEQKQTEIYKGLFKLFRDHKGSITGVTFWNVSDKHSWLDNFPVSGRKNYPLLFDQQLKPKKAYWEVVKTTD